MGEVIAFPARSVADGNPPSRRRFSPAAPESTAPRSTAPRSTAPRSAAPESTAPTPAAPESPAARSTAAHHPSSPAGREPLWREVTGDVLRSERLRQRRTLAQTADRAGMSVQYLSELERGRKEASSEMLAAACGSLGLSLSEFASRCAGQFAAVGARPTGPVVLAA